MASGAAIATPIWARKIVAKRYALNEQYESCLMDVVNTACMIPQKRAPHLTRGGNRFSDKDHAQRKENTPCRFESAAVIYSLAP
jgi:hypothetical protein